MYQKGCHFFIQVCVFVVILLLLLLAVLPLDDPLHPSGYRDPRWQPKKQQKQATSTQPHYHSLDSAAAGASGVRCAVGSAWQPEQVACVRDSSAALANDGVETDFIDDSVSPCSDFYQYACGRFVEDALNDDRDATFSPLSEAARASTESILENVARSRYRQPGLEEEAYPSALAAFYGSCRNSSSSNINGPLLQTLLQRIAAVGSHSELPQLFGLLARYDVGLPFRISVEVHPLNSSQKLPLLLQRGLASESVDVVASRLQLLQLQHTAASVVALDRAIEQLALPTAARSISEYIKASDSAEQDLAELQPDTLFDLLSAVETASYGVWQRGQPLWLFRRSFFEALPQLVQKTPLQVWQHYTRYQLLRRAHEADSAPHPDEAKYSLTHGRSRESQLPWSNSRRISLDEELKAQLRTLKASSDSACTLLTSVYLSELLDSYYIKLYRAAADDTVRKMDSSIRAAFVRYVESSTGDGLSDAVHSAFSDKLTHASSLLGTPTTPFTNSLLDGLSKRAPLSDNILLVHAAAVRRSWQAFEQPPDLSWYVTAASSESLRTPNAYYVPQLNGVVLHSALLAPPLLLSSTTLGLTARLGSLLAHEYAHSLDRVGMAHGRDGSLHNLFQESRRDRLLYEEALACVSDAFAAETGRVMQQLHRSPRLHITLNEDVADILGLRVAYAAAPILSRQDAQKFYLAYAQANCRRMSKDEKAEFSALREHSLPQVRVNMAAMGHARFADSWQCAAGSTAARHSSELGRCGLFRNGG